MKDTKIIVVAYPQGITKKDLQKLISKVIDEADALPISQETAGIVITNADNLLKPSPIIVAIDNINKLIGTNIRNEYKFFKFTQLLQQDASAPIAKQNFTLKTFKLLSEMNNDEYVYSVSLGLEFLRDFASYQLSSNYDGKDV